MSVITALGTVTKTVAWLVATVIAVAATWLAYRTEQRNDFVDAQNDCGHSLVEAGRATLALQVVAPEIEADYRDDGEAQQFSRWRGLGGEMALAWDDAVIDCKRFIRPGDSLDDAYLVVGTSRILLWAGYDSNLTSTIYRDAYQWLDAAEDQVSQSVPAGWLPWQPERIEEVEFEFASPN